MKIKNVLLGKLKFALTQSIVLACGMIWASSLSFAAPITYTINRVNGTGSLTGTVITDGTLGLLTAVNFLSLNLTVSSGAFSFAISGTPCSLQNPVPGNPCTVATPRVETTPASTAGLSATATQLTFDASFNSGNPVFKDLYFVSPNAANFYCVATQGLNCPGELFSGNFGTNRTTVGMPANGFGVILLGTAPAAPSGVPEPGVSALVLTGLGAIWLRRKKSVTRG